MKKRLVFLFFLSSLVLSFFSIVPVVQGTTVNSTFDGINEGDGYYSNGIVYFDRISGDCYGNDTSKMVGAGSIRVGSSTTVGRGQFVMSADQISDISIEFKGFNTVGNSDELHIKFFNDGADYDNDDPLIWMRTNGAGNSIQYFQYGGIGWTDSGGCAVAGLHTQVDISYNNIYECNYKLIYGGLTYCDIDMRPALLHHNPNIGFVTFEFTRVVGSTKYFHIDNLNFTEGYVGEFESGSDLFYLQFYNSPVKQLDKCRASILINSTDGAIVDFISPSNVIMRSYNFPAGSTGLYYMRPYVQHNWEAGIWSLKAKVPGESSYEDSITFVVDSYIDTNNYRVIANHERVPFNGYQDISYKITDGCVADLYYRSTKNVETEYKIQRLIGDDEWNNMSDAFRCVDAGYVYQVYLVNVTNENMVAQDSFECVRGNNLFIDPESCIVNTYVHIWGSFEYGGGCAYGLMCKGRLTGHVEMKDCVGSAFDYEIFFDIADTYDIYIYNYETNKEVEWSKKVLVVSDSQGYSEEDNNALLGVMVAVGVGMGLLVITGSVIAGLLTTGVMTFALSSPALGAYQLLPPEVGYGMIAVMVLGGVLYWMFS